MKTRKKTLLAAAKKISVDAAVVSGFYQKAGSVFTVKEEQTTALKEFLDRWAFALQPIFGESLVKRCGSPHVASDTKRNRLQ